MKKQFFLLAAAVAVLLSACSRYKYESVQGDPLQTRIYTLDNGLKVYMSVNKEKPRIQTYIAVRVGGKNDPAETTGLAHYFEHLMFKGSEQFGTQDYEAEKPLLDEIERLFEVYRQTTDEAERAAIYHIIDSISYEASKIAIPNEYDKLMAAIGAKGTNAYTSQDATVYIEDIPSNQIDNWAKIQADRFRHPVIRGFHTELETIYEEKNMSLTRDSRKVWEALDAALFPNHPYGKQTVLGTQEHLKNPSITNVKNYHKTYYIPNNMAVCVSGDFDPEEMIATIDKYFGTMEPNPALPKLEFPAEQPITTPVVKEVFGLESANVMLGWRLPGAADPETIMNNLVSAILYNGQAGLADLDLSQQQKVLSCYFSASTQPDYSFFIASGRPKTGQTLEEVRNLLLGEIAKLQAGEFDEQLLKASVNQYRKRLMEIYEENSGRANQYVQAFINGIDWADKVAQLDRMSKITKQDVVDWANKYLGADNYAIVYKREGKNASEQKIAAPKITPIVTNRDCQSDFLTAIQQSEVKPIEPQFVDFEKEMSQFDLRPGLHVLYKKNETNDLFTLTYIFNTGTEETPSLNLAFRYLEYLGTQSKSAEQIASEMYNLACTFQMSSGANQCSIQVSGLRENMGQAIDIVDDLLQNAVADDAILENLKTDLLKNRSNAKLSQSNCFSALQTYLIYGKDFITRRTLSNKSLQALTSEELLAQIRALTGKQHEVLYYGPESEEVFSEVFAAHHVTGDLEPLEPKYNYPQRTGQSKVVLVQYDAKQLYYLQYSNRGEKYDVRNDADLSLYNKYFGGGMNSVVFQEMREARGLAYSASATLSTPVHADGDYFYSAFIATQNDKMQQAVEAFDDIINNMPESETAFAIAKEGLLSRLRTERTTKSNVLNSFITLRRLGLDQDRNRRIFEQVQDMTLDDVKAAQQQWVKGRTYVYGILGDCNDIDLEYLKTLGPIEVVSREACFGY